MELTEATEDDDAVIGYFVATDTTIDQKTENTIDPDRVIPALFTIEKDNISETEIQWLARFFELIKVDQEGTTFIRQLMFPPREEVVEAPKEWVRCAALAITLFPRPFPCKEEILFKFASWKTLYDYEFEYPGVTKKVYNLIDRWLNAYHKERPTSNFQTTCYQMHRNIGKNSKIFIGIELPMVLFIANTWNGIQDKASRYFHIPSSAPTA